MEERKRSKMEQDVDRELIEKGISARDDFDATQAIHVSPRKRRSKLVCIRLSIEMMKDLRAAAESKGLPGYQGLIKSYIRTGLDAEQAAASAAASRKRSKFKPPEA